VLAIGPILRALILLAAFASLPGPALANTFSDAQVRQQTELGWQALYCCNQITRETDR
jgi:hypothetical protein